MIKLVFPNHVYAIPHFTEIAPVILPILFYVYVIPLSIAIVIAIPMILFMYVIAIPLNFKIVRVIACNLSIIVLVILQYTKIAPVIHSILFTIARAILPCISTKIVPAIPILP